MKTSKFAPKTPAQSLAHSRAEKLKQDKEKVFRLVGRLRWKAELLMVSYFRTMEIVQADLRQNGNHESHHAMESGATGQQAESMFKVDFFEFYTLLERYITDCLSILGFSVSGAAPRSNFNALRYITNPDLHKTRPMASHTFHANLLEALDDENCPLHQSFGSQEIRIQLGIAKDFRNAWKDADAKSNASNGTPSNGTQSKNIKLQNLQLELMLRMLVTGCEHSCNLIQNLTQSSIATTSRDFEPQTNGATMVDMEDAPFEYMDDAMDLD